VRRIVLAVMLCALTAVVVRAQDVKPDPAPPPADMKEGMEAMFGAMVPMMAKMAEVMVEASLKVAEKPETAARIATFKKNLYDQLQKQGFSKEEAFTIMLNTAVPSAAGMGMK
jgi:hypothetical protein